MNNTSSDTPPQAPSPGDLWFNKTDNDFYVHDHANRWIAVQAPSPGDLWFNTTDNNFYVHDHANRWIAVDDENNVVDIIMHDVNDPIEAYDRAMGIL